MTKVTGIKSVDFKVIAKGYGVVNWNGPTRLTGDDGKEVENHTLPKLRGYTNLTGKIKEETGYKYKKQATDINFKETPLYVSQNCIRHHLFREQNFDLHYAKDKNLSLDTSFDYNLIINAHPFLLETLINNLLSNAIRHSPEGSDISIAIEKNQLIFTNSGIESLVSENLFKRFSTTSKEVVGSGLGLAIVKEITTKYGWSIFYSFHGQKHTFSVTFLKFQIPSKS
jgi:signal transduction histidine kinase